MSNIAEREIFGDNRTYAEAVRRQPYRRQLRDFLSAFHARAISQSTPHDEAHQSLERIEKNAADILISSDTAARFMSMPEMQTLTRKQKKELRGSCAIGLSLCIDGRMPPVIIAGGVIDTMETKAGLIPTSISKLDGRPEIASSRLTEAIIDRPQKEDSQLLQINTRHGDSSKPSEINCAAIQQLVQRGLIPEDNPIAAFIEKLEDAGEAIGIHYNNSAKYTGKEPLKRVSVTAAYDTRTAGFGFDAPSGKRLFTTDVTKSLIGSRDLILLLNQAQPDIYRHSFTKPETLGTREQVMYRLERFLMQRGGVFSELVDEFITDFLPDDDFTAEQRKAFKFFIARNVSLQYTTGLYKGGEHPLSAHNEQYISFSPDGLRVGQYDPETQSFGATVSNHEDTLDHLNTKLGLMDTIGKSQTPYIAFLSKSLPEKTSFSSDRSARAELRSIMQVIYEDLSLRKRIKAGNLVVIPVILQEKTGTVLSIPNLAI